MCVLPGNVRAFFNRAAVDGVAAELISGSSPILSLNAYQREGNTCETIYMIDVPHTFKNGTLMPLHLSRLLTVGWYTLFLPPYCT